MTKATTVNKKILDASKAAANHKYDSSKYIVLDLGVRRDIKTGRLVTDEQTKKK